MTGNSGGDPNAGSSTERGKVDDNPVENLTPAQKAQLESLGRALDEAQREIRENKVDPKLLKDLGMTSEQFKGFVEEYSQRYGQIKDAIARTSGGASSGTVQQAGSDKLQTGQGIDTKVGDTAGGDKLSPDDLRKLNEAKTAKVAPEYRKDVEAFFRAISENARNLSSTPPAPTLAAPPK